jgi:predicted O-linked N-acetylglucosamine transferase (SPINDLY family)
MPLAVAKAPPAAPAPGAALRSAGAAAAAAVRGEPPELAQARAGRLPLAQAMQRAATLQAEGRADTAVALYEAYAANPRNPLRHVAHFNRGTLLALGVGEAAQSAAETAYRQALDLAPPDFHPPRLNLGHQMERRGDAEGALALWRAVHDAEPPAELEHRLHALNNAARLLEVIKRYPEAEALMRRSLELKPGQPDVIQHYVHIRQKQCAWPLYQPVGDLTVNQLLMGTSALAMMGLTDDPALQLLAAQRFVHERVPRPPAQPLWRQAGVRTPVAGRRLRVGYLSGDLHMHAVGLLTPELFELHDRSRFEVHAFCWTPESEMPQRRRIRTAMDHLVPIGGVDDATAARAIAAAGIDVLVDLQGLTSGARPGILVQRPAPVQVGYLGLPGTSAVPGVDWMLADRFVMPPELLPYCTERPVYLPHCYQVSDRQREVAPTPPRSRYGLPDDAFVYCSFNNNHKFTPETYAGWMRVLAAVPGSVLWLLADNETCRANLLREAAAQGIGAERLHFAPRVAPPEYLARFACADLMLDTFPFNAGTTASDALWMGLPIVTRSGRTYISRMAGSLLHAVGLPDLVTESQADYERLAITLGRQPARVASCRRYLAEHGRASPLFDLPQRVRDIEAAFEDLVQRTAP